MKTIPCINAAGGSWVLSALVSFSLAACAPALGPQPSPANGGTAEADSGAADTATTPAGDAGTVTNDAGLGASGHAVGATCPLDFAFVSSDGFVLIESQREQFLSDAAGVAKLVELAPRCAPNLTIWRHLPTDAANKAKQQRRVEDLHDKITKGSGSRYGMNYTIDTPMGSVPGSHDVLPGQDRGPGEQTVRVPVPVGEQKVNCLDQALGVPPNEIARRAAAQRELDRRWATGPAFAGVQVRHRYENGTMVILVPSASPPAALDRRCPASWKESPALVTVPKTRLPMIWTYDAKVVETPRTPQKHIAAR